MVQLLRDHIGKAFVTGVNEYQVPVVELAEHTQYRPIYPLEVMDIEQVSINGNMQSIQRALTAELKYSNQDLMEDIFLVGGDQLLLDRVRSIKRVQESDVPGEDFSYVNPLLGPLHTKLNKKRSIMKRHMGPSDGSQLGTLRHFNKVLRRTKIDESVKDLWACMDLTRDSLDGVLLAMMVEEAGYQNWDSFRVDLIAGKFEWRQLILKMDTKLGYQSVFNLRREGRNPTRYSGTL